MDELIAEITSFAEEVGCTPELVLRDAIKAGWGQWRKWLAREASPTMRNVDKIREHMASVRAVRRAKHTAQAGENTGHLEIS